MTQLPPPPLAQPARGEGYRVNVDAYHLAAFAEAGGRVARCAFDLGAGVGAVGITLLDRNATKRAVLVEIDEVAAALARKNLESRGHDARGEVVFGDALSVARARAGEADLVVCNPPYVEPGKGRVPGDPRRARARVGPLERFVDAARHASGRRARVCFVYPAREIVTLLGLLRARGLEPKRIRAVHTHEGAKARVVLVESMAGKPGGLVVEPPLYDAPLVPARRRER